LLMHQLIEQAFRPGLRHIARQSHARRPPRRSASSGKIRCSSAC
jgi:hypothetical protein